MTDRCDRRTTPSSYSRRFVFLAQTLAPCALILGLVTLAGSPSAQADDDYPLRSTRKIERVFEGPVRELRIDALWGSISVRTHDRPTVELQIVERVRAESPAWAERAASEVTLEIDQSDGVVELFVDGPFRDPLRPGHWMDNGNDMRYAVVYDFVARVPRDIDLDLRTVLESGIQVDGVRGSVTLIDVVGPIRLENVVIDGRVETVSASIEAQMMRAPDAPLSFKTISGDIDARFPSSLAADLRFDTSWGDAWSAFELVALPVVPEVEHLPGGKTRIHSNAPSARVGGGGPLISFSSLSGDVNLRKGDQP